MVIYLVQLEDCHWEVVLTLGSFSESTRFGKKMDVGNIQKMTLDWAKKTLKELSKASSAGLKFLG